MKNTHMKETSLAFRKLQIKTTMNYGYASIIMKKIKTNRTI